MIGPVLFTTIFVGSIGRYRAWNQPGAAFAVAAILIAVSMVMAARVTRPAKSAAAPVLREDSLGAL